MALHQPNEKTQRHEIWCDVRLRSYNTLSLNQLLVGKIIASIFSSQSTREKRAEFDGVIRLNQKI